MMAMLDKDCLDLRRLVAEGSGVAEGTGAGARTGVGATSRYGAGVRSCLRAVGGGRAGVLVGCLDCEVEGGMMGKDPIDFDCEKMVSSWDWKEAFRLYECCQSHMSSDGYQVPDSGSRLSSRSGLDAATYRSPYPLSHLSHPPLVLRHSDPFPPSSDPVQVGLQ